MALADKNRGPEILAVFCSCTALAALAVAMRLWVRAKIIRKVGLDDWLVALSLLLTLVSLGLLIPSVHSGVGRHIEFLSLDKSRNAIKFLWITFCFTPSAEGLAKASISIMLIRITTSKNWKNFFYVLIVAIIMTTITSLVVLLLGCRPWERLWDPTVNGTCKPNELKAMLYIQGVVAAAYDILLAISPIGLLWNVKIDVRKKMLLCGLLALGFFTSIAGIIRITYTLQVSGSEDPTWGAVNFLIWKTVELTLSIIVGCLPTLRPLFRPGACSTSHTSANGTKMCPKTVGSLTDQTELSSQNNKICHTTTISVVTAQRSSKDSTPEHNIWTVEDRV